MRIGESWRTAGDGMDGVGMRKEWVGTRRGGRKRQKRVLERVKRHQGESGEMC